MSDEEGERLVKLAEEWRMRALGAAAMFLRPQAELLANCANELLAALDPPAPQEPQEAREPETRFMEPETGVVYRIVVYLEDGRFAAEFVTGDGKSAGMGDTANTPVGALAELCAMLIKLDEDDAHERAAPQEPKP